MNWKVWKTSNGGKKMSDVGERSLTGTANVEGGGVGAIHKRDQSPGEVTNVQKGHAVVAGR